MKKLYLKYPYMRSLDTTFSSIQCIDDKYHIETDQTIFCPRIENLCPHDYGTINDIEVLDIYDKDNRVIHVVETKPLGSTANLRLKWDTRRHILEYLTTKTLIELYLSHFINIVKSVFQYQEHRSRLILYSNDDAESILPYLEKDMLNFIDSGLNITVDEKFERAKSYTVKRYYGTIHSLGSVHLKHMLLSNTSELYHFKLLNYAVKENAMMIDFKVGLDVKKDMNRLYQLKEEYLNTILQKYLSSNSILLDLTSTSFSVDDVLLEKKEYFILDSSSFRAKVLPKTKEKLKSILSFYEKENTIYGTYKKEDKEKICDLLQT